MLMRSTGEKVFAFFNGLIMLILSLTMLIPLLSVLKDSLDLGGQADVTISFIPHEFTLIYYRMVFMDSGVFRPFLNSVMITAVGTSLSLVINAMGAYTLSRKELRGSKFFVYFLVVIPMVFGGGGVIANYIWFKAIGILNSYFVLFLPLLATGFWMIIIRQFYLTIPFSLTESAWLDGAPEFVIYRKIIAPLSKSVFAAMALFIGVQFWNQWLQAIYYVHNPKYYTFPVKLRGMLFYGQDIEIQMQELAMSLGIDPEEVLIAFEGLSGAMIVVAILPVLIAYPYLQKHFASGVRVGAIKG
jgi:putative aldouronate transport system permease protein